MNDKFAAEEVTTVAKMVQNNVHGQEYSFVSRKHENRS